MQWELQFGGGGGGGGASSQVLAHYGKAGCSAARDRKADPRAGSRVSLRTGVSFKHPGSTSGRSQGTRKDTYVLMFPADTSVSCRALLLN